MNLIDLTSDEKVLVVALIYRSVDLLWFVLYELTYLLHGVLIQFPKPTQIGTKPILMDGYNFYLIKLILIDFVSLVFV